MKKVTGAASTSVSCLDLCSSALSMTTNGTNMGSSEPKLSLRESSQIWRRPPRSKLEASLAQRFLSTNVAVALNRELTVEVNLLWGRMAKTASADTRKFSGN